MSTTNKTAAAIGQGITDVAAAGIAAVEALIIADVPALGLPVISGVWEALLNWIMGYVVRAAENGATFTVIDVQIANEESALSVALSQLIQAEKTGDAAKIKAAIQNYANANSSLINSDGSSPAQ